MDFRNCPTCFKLFKFIGSSLCPSCTDEKEKQFKIVRDYVRDNPKATISEVSQATQISIVLITYMLEEGRIIKVDAPQLK